MPRASLGVAHVVIGFAGWVLLAGCNHRYVTRITVREPSRVLFEQSVGAPIGTIDPRSTWARHANGRTLEKPFWSASYEVARINSVAFRDGSARMAVGDYTAITPSENVERIQIVDRRGGWRPWKVLFAGLVLGGGGVALTAADDPYAGMGVLLALVGAVTTGVGIVEIVRPRDSGDVAVPPPVTPP